jgi:hypothetical protein
MESPSPGPRRTTCGRSCSIILPSARRPKESMTFPRFHGHLAWGDTGRRKGCSSACTSPTGVPATRGRAGPAARAPIRETAGSLGISESCLRNWIARAGIDDRSKPGLSSDERAELAAGQAPSGAGERDPQASGRRWPAGSCRSRPAATTPGATGRAQLVSGRTWSWCRSSATPSATPATPTAPRACTPSCVWAKACDRVCSGGRLMRTHRIVACTAGAGAAAPARPHPRRPGCPSNRGRP